MSQQEMSAPRVGYVAGYGRSGSTTLARLLGQEQGVLAAGELVGIHEWIDSSRPCGCGAAIHECPFWSRVRVAMKGLKPGGRRWFPAIESPFSLLLGYWWIPQVACNAYRRWNQHLFRSLAIAGGARIIIDSSKSSFRVAGRAQALASVADLDVRLIHLVRSPQAVRESLMQGTNRQLEGRAPMRRFFPRLRAFTGWLLANWAARFTAAAGAIVGSRLLRYEELVGNPQRTLAELEQLMEHSFTRAIELTEGNVQPVRQHLAEGNRMRFEPFRLRALRIPEATAADRWLCALICGPLSRRLGYSRSGDADCSGGVR